jgi:transcriptional regulator with XRE-family HTH domain
MQTPRLRYWRDYRALTLHELAAKAGVAYRTVWRLENGYPAEARTVRKLAAALGVEPHQLQGLDGEQRPGQQEAAA